MKKGTTNEKYYLKKFLIPIYERQLKIIVCNDIKFALDLISYDDYDDDDSIEATVIEGPKGLINLIIRPSATINTISHESFHIVVSVLDGAGMGLCDKSEEAYAYLLGWVAERVEYAIKGY